MEQSLKEVFLVVVVAGMLSGNCSKENWHCSRWYDLMGQQHPKVSCPGDHEGGMVHHKGVSLLMEVFEHFIRVPAVHMATE